MAAFSQEIVLVLRYCKLRAFKKFASGKIASYLLLNRAQKCLRFEIRVKEVEAGECTCKATKNLRLPRLSLLK